MVKPATTSSNTPIKQRDRARESSSCSPASESPDSYHYSTKLRCIPPGGRTSPSPSPSLSPSPSQSQSQSPTTRGRTTTPPPESPATSCRLTSLTINNNNNSPPHGSAIATTDPSKPPAPPTPPQPTSAPASPTSPHAAALAYRFPPQTPPPRPRNPLAKQKAFTDPSPVHRGAARPTTQEQLEVLRGRGFGGLFEAFERAEGGERRRSEIEDEDGDVVEQVKDEDKGEESTSKDGKHVATTTAASSSSSSSPNHPSTTDHTHAYDPNDESDVSAQALLSHRTHAAAAYEAARLARCAAPEDLAIKAAYVEARAAYDAARRAYANAVMDEEEMLEAAARKARKEEERVNDEEGRDGRKGKGTSKGKGKEKGKDKGKGKEKKKEMLDAGRGGMMARQGDEGGGGEREGRAAVQQPPSPSPSPTGEKQKQKQKQRGRIASPLERLERSVRRMKVNRAI